ncbi:MAG: hypothetical protein ACPGES_08655 [Coraliomargarita sp.]
MVYLRCFALSACFLLGHLLAEKPRIRTIEGAHFTAVGADARSLSYVEALTDSLTSVGEKYLKDAPLDFQPKVFVALRPEEHVSFEDAYQITQDGAKINLNFNWTEGLSLETACYALSEAYLRQYSIYQYGPDGPRRIREWVVSAFAYQTYLRLRPAAYIAMVESARLQQVPNCATILERPLKDTSKHELQSGYWVLQVLRSAGFSRMDIAYYCERAVAGDNVFAALQTTLQPAGTKELVVALQDWWNFQFRELMGAQLERFESMDESREWIEVLANFDAYKEEDRDLDNLRSLWKHREDEALRETLQARLELIRLRVVQVNPAYFNAARSLGALYETVLESEKKFEFIRALTVYLRDYEDTKRLHGKVLKELN